MPLETLRNPPSADKFVIPSLSFIHLTLPSPGRRGFWLILAARQTRVCVYLFISFARPKENQILVLLTFGKSIKHSHFTIFSLRPRGRLFAFFCCHQKKVTKKSHRCMKIAKNLHHSLNCGNSSPDFRSRVNRDPQTARSS